MLFNSVEFIFLFLPAAVILHFWLARWSPVAAVIGTTFASLAFYAWWNPPYVLLPVLSVLANYWLARRIAQADKSVAFQLTVAGIVANVLVLCHYKYADFLLSILDGHKAVPPNVPLALSFTTFVQIAFLAYVYQRRLKFEFWNYALFVVFFPHLIAGPIVRWTNFGRQLGDAERYRLDWNNVALGLTIFTFGLAKKVLVADPLSPHVATVFDAATRGDPITAVAAWGATTAFMLQIYFDFSGYSDMAVGLGLLFNFRLPINFAAPLRATSIADLWRRWHITLARLARDLIYVPLARGDTGFVWRSSMLMLTMIVIGVWHGAGWPFVIWGAYNGILLVGYQVWQQLRGPSRKTLVGGLFGWALTLTLFSASGVFFRAPDIETSWSMIKAMAGLSGAVHTGDLSSGWNQWVINQGYLSEFFVRHWFGATWSAAATVFTLVALAVALLVPDTMEITNYREGDAQSDWRRKLTHFAWQPSFVALGAVLVLFGIAFLRLHHVSEFLYYQF
jgi:alginate O-acetyltransferase complex protein AlgI